MKKVLLDTNVFSAFLKGDEFVLNELAESDVIFMSSIVMGELFAGFHGGNKFVENKNILSLFLKKPGVTILNATFETADVFGHVKNLLKKAGTPLPINDIWIAAHTMESGSKLLTYDRHFKKIPGLRIWDRIG